jgi:MEMO1 family protein
VAQCEVEPAPRLRAVDAVRVIEDGVFALSLRDPDGLSRDVIVKPPLDLALPYMDGRRSISAIAETVARRHASIPTHEIEALVARLDEAFLLVNARSKARLDELHSAFRRDEIRRARHAGGAYAGDAQKLRRFIERDCIEAAAESPRPTGMPRALIAPHMDHWRARRGYGDAYGAIASHALDAIELVVLLGTCHAPMAEPFALTRKDFETPLGRVPTARRAIDGLASRAGFDVFYDEVRHKEEHSLELQLPFLQHLFGERPFEILPVLCGLGDAQVSERDPSQDETVEAFLHDLIDVCASDEVLIVAGADLAHVGPRFGDPDPLDGAGRRRLADRDNRSIDAVLSRDAPLFFAHTTSDQRERRVCGVGPIYTLMRSLEGSEVDGHVLAYHQHVDPDEGSIVSHAEVLFTRKA